MKHYIIAIIALLLISGCKSNRPLISTSSEIKTEEYIQKDISTTVNTTENEQSSLSKIKTVVEDETTTTIRTDYDTDKPMDPVTGKYPVKSETTTETKKNRKEEKKSNENITKNADSESNMIDKSNIKTNYDMKESIVEENSKDPYHYRYVFYTILSILLIVFGIVIYLKKTKVLSFIKKIFRN